MASQNDSNAKKLVKTRKRAYNTAMLREYRLKLGLTQSQLAEELGVSFRTIQYIEAGRNGRSGIIRRAIESWIRQVEAEERVAKQGLPKREG